MDCSCASYLLRVLTADCSATYQLGGGQAPLLVPFLLFHQDAAHIDPQLLALGGGLSSQLLLIEDFGFPISNTGRTVCSSLRNGYRPHTVVDQLDSSLGLPFPSGGAMECGTGHR